MAWSWSWLWKISGGGRQAGRWGTGRDVRAVAGVATDDPLAHPLPVGSTSGLRPHFPCPKPARPPARSRARVVTYIVEAATYQWTETNCVVPGGGWVELG